MTTKYWPLQEVALRPPPCRAIHPKTGNKNYPLNWGIEDPPFMPQTENTGIGAQYPTFPENMSKSDRDLIKDLIDCKRGMKYELFVSLNGWTAFLVVAGFPPRLARFAGEWLANEN
jgi:hypothetical protein